MEHAFIKKVIRASAGTGKTYRLSLEYIGLLVKFHHKGVHFSEILVITFTKKATAEIRERIFSHLAALTDPEKPDVDLLKNLAELTGVRLSDSDLRMLRHVYQEMLMNKHQVQVQTIDAFTNSIFKSIIAPYLGITDFVIQNDIDQEVKAELAKVLLDVPENFATLQDFFHRSELRTIQDYDSFIDSIIRNRWLVHLAQSSERAQRFAEKDQAEQIELLEHYRDAFVALAHEYVEYLRIEKPDKTVKQVVNKDYFDLLFENPPADFADIPKAIDEKLSDPQYVCKNLDVLLDDKNFWNGSAVFRKKADAALKEHFTTTWQELKERLGTFVFYTLVLPEEKQILHIANLIYSRYDELKLMDKVFTFSDVAFYTFKHLYDPELSLIEGDFVANSFYEYLSNQLRFVLIDEYQDTSILQYKVLLPMIKEVVAGLGMKDYGGVVVVGDEKQSIYGWRGGERDLLPAMPQILQNAEEILLDKSFRSDENIITFINALCGSNDIQTAAQAFGFEWPYEDVIPDKKNASGFVQAVFQQIRAQSYKSQAPYRLDALKKYLQTHLLKLIDDGELNPQTTAILARRNADLLEIAGVLDELGVSYVLESSKSIIDHRIIRPLFLFLRFWVYRDFYTLLAFLRSDFVLLKTSELKKLLLTFRDDRENRHDVLKMITACADMPVVEKLLTLMDQLTSESSLAAFFKRVAESFNAAGHFPLESDIKNLHHFLRMVTEFEQNNREYPRTFFGLHSFLQDNQDREILQQVGLDKTNALSLLTIHKAKGLEFESVFVIWNLSQRGNFSKRSFVPHLEYTQDFTDVASSLFCFNYEKWLKFTPCATFDAIRKRREAIETLNTFYVALTRPKSNLFMYFTFAKDDGLQAFITDQNKDEPHMPSLAVQAIYKSFADIERNDENEFTESAQQGVITIESIKDGTEKFPKFEYAADYLTFDQRKLLIKNDERLEREKYIDFKTAFLENRSVEKGNIAHFYLSFIRYNTPEEKAFAEQQTLAFYGSLLARDEIQNIFSVVNDFIQQHAEYFSTDAWPKVFNEYTLFDKNGREIRIDRMMVNEKTKKVLIIDYKTGNVFEKEQIEHYIESIMNLPHIARDGFDISGEYLHVPTGS